MTKDSLSKADCPHPGRAMIKIIVIMLAVAVVCAGIAVALDNTALNQLKFDLSLWTLIAVVVAINVLSFISITMLFFAYQWVRRDLKKPRIEDETDPADGV